MVARLHEVVELVELALQYGRADVAFGLQIVGRLVGIALVRLLTILDPDGVGAVLWVTVVGRDVGVEVRRVFPAREVLLQRFLDSFERVDIRPLEEFLCDHEETDGSDTFGLLRDTDLREVRALAGEELEVVRFSAEKIGLKRHEY